METLLQDSFLVEEKIIFPIKIQDLPNNAILGMTLYDMKRPQREALLAATTISVFDCQQKMR